MEQSQMQYIVDKAIFILAALLSAKGLWEVAKSYISRNKTKAETDNIIAETYKDLIVHVRNELSEVRKENVDQAKEMAQMRVDHNRELNEERLACAENMKLMHEKIVELQAQINILTQRK